MHGMHSHFWLAGIAADKTVSNFGSGAVVVNRAVPLTFERGTTDYVALRHGVIR